MKNVGRRGRRFAVAAGLAALVLAVQGARAQVMQQVPADALVVVKVNNLKGTSDKIAALANQFGIAQMVEQLGDPLGSLQKEMKLQNGLATDGEAALVFLDPSKTGAKGRGGPDKSMVLLVPVSDYKAFLTNFGKPTEETDKPAADGTAKPAAAAAPVTDANGITTVAFPSSFETAYVAQWGNYAAISPLQSAISAKPAGGAMKVQGVSEKTLASNDIAVFANIPAMKERGITQLKAGRPRFLADLKRGMASNPQNKQYEPLVNVAVNRLFDGMEQFLTDAQGAAYGITFSKEGIKTTLLGEFAEGSPFGKAVSEIKNSDKSVLAGLPQGKYLFYGGAAWDGKAIGNLFDQAMGPVKTELASAGEKAAPIAKMVDAYRQVFAATDSSAAGMVAPTGAIGQEAIFQMVSVSTGDAKALVEANRTLLTAQDDLSKLNADPNNKVTTTFTPDAKQVGGVSFSKFEMKFDLKPKTPQEMQAAQGIKMVYGPNGLVGYIGAIDDKHVVGGFSVPDATLEKVVASAKAGEDVLGGTKGVQLVNANLPKQRVMAFYVPVDQIVLTGANYAKQFGMPVNLQLPPGLAPVGVTVSTDGTAARVDSFIPATTVQSLIAAGMQAFMAMQGGQAPGGPGGL